MVRSSRNPEDLWPESVVKCNKGAFARTRTDVLLGRLKTIGGLVCYHYQIDRSAGGCRCQHGGWDKEHPSLCPRRPDVATVHDGAWRRAGNSPCIPPPQSMSRTGSSGFGCRSLSRTDAYDDDQSGVPDRTADIEMRGPIYPHLPPYEAASVLLYESAAAGRPQGMGTRLARRIGSKKARSP